MYDFRRFSLYYYRYKHGYRDIKIQIVKELLNPYDGVILDLGSGAGVFTRLCQRLGYEVISLDYSMDMLRYSKVNGVCGDGCRLPFRNNLFDIVLCLDVIEHVYKPFSLLKETYRVLKPGGKIILSTDNITPQSKLTSILTLNIKNRIRHNLESTHIREYTPQELITYLKKFFKVKRIIPYNEYRHYLKIKRFIEKTSRLTKYLWGKIIIVGEKP